MEQKLSAFRAWLERNGTVRVLLIVFLLALCAVELRGLIADLRATEREAFLTYRQGHIIRPADNPTPEDIAPWMTLAYVNFLFKLDPSYLKSALAITDARYPNVQIARYARQQGLNVDQFLASVRSAVRAHSQ